MTSWKKIAKNEQLYNKLDMILLLLKEKILIYIYI